MPQMPRDMLVTPMMLLLLLLLFYPFFVATNKIVHHKESSGMAHTHEHLRCSLHRSDTVIKLPQPPILPGGIPGLIHQSWKNETIPATFHDWPSTWRTHHSEWHYHLWTDEDNRALIQHSYPWFLKTYDALPSGVMRADASRLFYMHRYGVRGP